MEFTTARAAAGHDGAATAAGATTPIVPTAAVKAASATAAISKAAAPTTPQHVQRLLLVHTHRLAIDLHLSHEKCCSGMHPPVTASSIG